MTYLVSITSQGQISIPAPLRRKLGLDKSKKAVVTEKNGGLIIEPVKDLLELRGLFKTTTKATSKETREAFENYLGSRAVLKSK